MTLRLTSSAETAANFRRSYEARRDAVGRRAIIPKKWTLEETDALRELVLSKVGRLVAKMPTQLRADVADDWGRVCPRRIERALKSLLEAGEIVRVPDGYLLARRARRAA